jgi:hypothetical protein
MSRRATRAATAAAAEAPLPGRLRGALLATRPKTLTAAVVPFLVGRCVGCGDTPRAARS